MGPRNAKPKPPNIHLFKCMRVATKLMNALEFSHDTQYALREFSAQVYGFDTGSLVDTSYIRERMSGHSTSLYQEVSL